MILTCSVAFFIVCAGASLLVYAFSFYLEPSNVQAKPQRKAIEK